jgi:hypothetical protein
VAIVDSCSPRLAASYGVDWITWPTAAPCRDGVDNDGDGRADAADAGCFDADSPREDPRCQNGLDDDGDGRVDADGGRSANGGVALAAADAQCLNAYQDWEAAGACGLGAELVAVAWLLSRARRVGDRTA